MGEDNAVKEIMDTIMESDLKVSEKLHLMNAFLKKDRKTVSEAKQTVVKGYRYCPVCMEWYLEDSWREGFEYTSVSYCPVGHLL